MWKEFQSRLFLAILLFLLIGQFHALYAAKPLTTVGKPALEDILYSPDGRYLATLTTQYITTQYVEFLDAETFEPLSRLELKNGGGRSLAFSPDGSLLAVYSWREGIMLWDVASKTLFATIPVKTTIFAFSPDGKHLAYALKDSVFLWDIARKETVRELTGDSQPPVKEWVTSDGEVKHLEAEPRVEVIAFHPNGRILAVGSLRPTIALWDIQSGEILSYLKVGERAWVGWKMAFSHDGSMLAGQTSGGGLGFDHLSIESKSGWE